MTGSSSNRNILGTDEPCVSQGLRETVLFGTVNLLHMGLLVNLIPSGTVIMETVGTVGTVALCCRCEMKDAPRKVICTLPLLFYCFLRTCQSVSCLLYKFICAVSNGTCLVETLGLPVPICYGSKWNHPVGTLSWIQDFALKCIDEKHNCLKHLIQEK